MSDEQNETLPEAPKGQQDEAPPAPPAPPVNVIVYTTVDYDKKTMHGFEAVSSSQNRTLVTFKGLPGNLLKQTLLEISTHGVMAFSEADQLLTIPSHRVEYIKIVKVEGKKAIPLQYKPAKA